MYHQRHGAIFRVPQRLERGYQMNLILIRRPASGTCSRMSRVLRTGMGGSLTVNGKSGGSIRGRDGDQSPQGAHSQFSCCALGRGEGRICPGDHRRKVDLFQITLFGSLLCLDGFLYNFTVLPVRSGFAVYRIARDLFTKRQISPIPPNHLQSLLRMMLLFIPTVVLLLATDASKMYHTVRGQDTIKLYVIFNALEVRLTPQAASPGLTGLDWRSLVLRIRTRRSRHSFCERDVGADHSKTWKRETATASSTCVLLHAIARLRP